MTIGPLGFLTVLHEAGSYVGGYLVTNGWGRPLEFRLSTAVQPNRVQQILYADTLTAYLCGEIIGRALVEKTTTVAQVLLTDTFDTLSLRTCIEIPVVWLAPADYVASNPSQVISHPSQKLLVHPDYPDDAVRLRDLFDRLSGLDLLEPFTRIRHALTEARKMGVMQRAG